jgi:hypothetical protein
MPQTYNIVQDGSADIVGKLSLNELTGQANLKLTGLTVGGESVPGEQRVRLLSASVTAEELFAPALGGGPLTLFSLNPDTMIIGAYILIADEAWNGTNPLVRLEIQDALGSGEVLTTFYNPSGFTPYNRTDPIRPAEVRSIFDDDGTAIGSVIGSGTIVGAAGMFLRIQGTADVAPTTGELDVYALIAEPVS